MILVASFSETLKEPDAVWLETTELTCSQTLPSSNTSSKEGTTQGDSTAMAAYALGVTPLLHFFHEFASSHYHSTKEESFADDFTISRKISEIKEYWDLLTLKGPMYGYFPKASKSHLIVKRQREQKAKDIFHETNVTLLVNDI